MSGSISNIIVTGTNDGRAADQSSVKEAKILHHLVPQLSKEPYWYEQVKALTPHQVNKLSHSDPQAWISRFFFNGELYETSIQGLNQKIKTLIDLVAKIQTPSFVNRFIKYLSIPWLQMRGVSLLASYLQIKKGIQGLYVCTSLEALKAKIEEISQSPSDMRCALVVPAALESRNEKSPEYETFAQHHKVTVCVEKKGNSLKIALLDSLPIKEVSAKKVKSTPQAILQAAPVRNDDNDYLGHHLGLSYEDAILWYIFNSDLNRCSVTIYCTAIERQYADFGCPAFALKDAVAFLEEPRFFEKIRTQHNIYSDEHGYHLPIQSIVLLPPEFMKGTQSLSSLRKYVKVYSELPPDNEIETLKNLLNIPLPPELEGDQLLSYLRMYAKMSGQVYINNEIEKLQSRIKKHLFKDRQKEQNGYNSERHFKYCFLLLKTLETMQEHEIEKIIAETTISAKRRSLKEGEEPMTLNDIGLVYHPSNKGSSSVLLSVKKCD
jgi:hypothetical protein